MANRILLWLTPLLACALVACESSVRVVKVAPSSGELALHGDRGEARAQAKSFISQHCPGGHDVVHDGVTVVGSRPEMSMTAFGRHHDAAATDLLEWRLHYRCVSATAPEALSLVTAEPAPASESRPAPPEAPPADEPPPPPVAVPSAPPANNWY